MASARAPKTPKTAAVPATPATVTSPLPPGFVSPFTRVEMAPGARIDDGLACVAMLAHKTLDEVTKLAHQFGLPEHGPAWVYAPLLRKLLAHYDLVVSEEKEAASIDVLPDVAMIAAYFNPDTQYGRWVLWHHIKGTDQQTAFHYAYDPAYWVPEKMKITTDFRQLCPPKQSIWYLEITAKPSGKAKGK